VLSDTASPVWDEHFFYEDLEETKLAGRVLEARLNLAELLHLLMVLQITLWDFDPYESHSFMGETLVELANAPLNNQPFLYNLLDMDEENPIRMVILDKNSSLNQILKNYSGSDNGASLP